MEPDREDPDALYRAFENVLSWIGRRAGGAPANRHRDQHRQRIINSSLIHKTQNTFGFMWPALLPQERLLAVDAVVAVFCKSRTQDVLNCEEIAVDRLLMTIGFDASGPSEHDLAVAEYHARANAASSGIPCEPSAFERVHGSVRAIKQACEQCGPQAILDFEGWQAHLFDGEGGITRRKLERARSCLQAIIVRLDAVASSVHAHQLRRPALPSSDDILLDAWNMTQWPRDHLDTIVDLLLDAFNLYLVQRNRSIDPDVDPQIEDLRASAHQLGSEDSTHSLRIDAILQQVRALQARNYPDLQHLAGSIARLEDVLQHQQADLPSQCGGVSHFATLPVEQQELAVAKAREIVFELCETYATTGTLRKPEH
ncbi:hypothetical protein DMC30DRAFT_419508 [Rhodotorula diobovata]|uniref:Uncharacterized protein n=1 Tax=Rhodotorula diobovata TaxID=5288 RepID=A0A5C5FPJ7_9BASI|nr:hypothetical protein DMC30DRAFT_419508 [Rhodotorula diobovata]